MTSEMKRKKIILWVFLAFLGALLAYVWYGLLFPDPYYLNKFWPVYKFLYIWGTRLLIPLFYVALVLALASNKKKLFQNLSLLLLSLFVLLLVAYPVMDIAYFMKIRSKNKIIREKYHSYLQLIPPADSRLTRPAGKQVVRIFCLGGSTTEFKDSQGVGWPDRLEAELRNIYHTDSIQVFNFGKQWYTSLHSLINYETNLRQYKPDVILVMDNINDVIQNADFSYLSNGPFRDDYGHFYGPASFIFKRSGLFGFLWTSFRTMWYHKDRLTFDQDTFPGLPPFTRNLNTLIDLAKTDSTKVVLLTQPNVLTENMDENVTRACVMINYEAVGPDKRWGYKTAYWGAKQYNDRIREIASKRNVYLVDLEKFIPKSLTYFNDEVHYNDTTFNLISSALSKEIVRLKILPFYPGN
jgi:hypothetical protein